VGCSPRNALLNCVCVWVCERERERGIVLDFTVKCRVYCLHRAVVVVVSIIVVLPRLTHISVFLCISRWLLEVTLCVCVCEVINLSCLCIVSAVVVLTQPDDGDWGR
jgi:hypothetical protein